MKKIISVILVIVFFVVLIITQPASADATQLDTSGTKIGDMTVLGLDRIFDGQGTSSYAQATSGYVGVVFSTPHTISSVQIDSQPNGFDASGLTTQITLTLYGRTSGVPSYSTDGTLIGNLSAFTDINSVTTKTITSTDTTTQFSCVWVRIQTGVWSAATEMRIYGDDDGFTSTPTNTATETLTPTVTNTPTITPTATSVPGLPEITNNITLLESHIDEIANMTYYGAELSGFRIRFKLNNPAAIKALLSVDVIHQGDITGYQGAISIGFNIAYKYSETLEGLTTASYVTVQQDESLRNVTRGVNIDERSPGHYAEITIPQNFDLQPGYYEFTVFGRAATTASGYTTTNGLAALIAEPSTNPDHGLNGFFIDVFPGADIIEVP
jgi:hypothetical protein